MITNVQVGLRSERVVETVPNPLFSLTKVQFGKDTYFKGETIFLTKFWSITAGHSFAVRFNERETSPSLVKVKEGETLQLKCSYCVKSSKEGATLSWYKDGHLIGHGINNQSAVLGVPMVLHNRDEGLYKCLVTYKKQNISKLITVIVNKGGFFRTCFINTGIQGGMSRIAQLEKFSLNLSSSSFVM